MKVQEVIMRAMAKQMTWWQAAEILGVSTRTIRRMKRNWKKAGFDGLYDHRHHRPSPKHVSVEKLERVLRLYRDRYSDFNVRHFHEKLCEEHGIHYSYTWVKKALQTSGLVATRRQHGPHRRRRPSADSWDVATHRRQPTSMVSRRTAVRSDCVVARDKPSNSPIASFRFPPHAFARHWLDAASLSMNI